MDRNTTKIAVVAVTVLLVLATGRIGHCQELVPSPEWNRGYHGLAMLGRSLELTVETDRRAWQRHPPEKTVLVLLGEVRSPPVDVYNYVRAGGAVLIASDRGDYGTMSRLGITLGRGPYLVASPDDGYRGFVDCAIATQLSTSHPTTRGVQSLVTNRPGALGLRRRSRDTTRVVLAQLPKVQFVPGGERMQLAGAFEWRGGGRCVVVADQSVFSNQMMLAGDNAVFALRSLQWLGKDRTHLMVVSGNRIIDPVNAADIEVVLPPPTPREVAAALRNMPPEVLVKFGNSVVQIAEDEGILNEFIGEIIRRMQPHTYRRLLIVLTTMAVCFIGLRRIARGTPANEDSRHSRPGGIHAVLPARERQRAAAQLLADFRDEIQHLESVTNRPDDPGHRGSEESWREFCERLNVANDVSETTGLRHRLIQADHRVRTRRSRYWKRRRLQSLDAQIQHWRRLHADGRLQYDSVDV